MLSRPWARPSRKLAVVLRLASVRTAVDCSAATHVDVPNGRSAVASNCLSVAIWTERVTHTRRFFRREALALVASATAERALRGLQRLGDRRGCRRVGRREFHAVQPPPVSHTSGRRSRPLCDVSATTAARQSNVRTPLLVIRSTSTSLVARKRATASSAAAGSTPGSAIVHCPASSRSASAPWVATTTSRMSRPSGRAASSRAVRRRGQLLR